jgi:hypothetical protein
MRPSTASSIFGAMLITGSALAQERCDAPSPGLSFCNTTSILAYESADCTPYHVLLAGYSTLSNVPMSRIPAVSAT